METDKLERGEKRVMPIEETEIPPFKMVKTARPKRRAKRTLSLFPKIMKDGTVTRHPYSCPIFGYQQFEHDLWQIDHAIASMESLLAGKLHTLVDTSLSRRNGWQLFNSGFKAYKQVVTAGQPWRPRMVEKHCPEWKSLCAEFPGSSSVQTSWLEERLKLLVLHRIKHAFLVDRPKLLQRVDPNKGWPTLWTLHPEILRHTEAALDGEIALCQMTLILIQCEGRMNTLDTEARALNAMDLNAIYNPRRMYLSTQTAYLYIHQFGNRFEAMNRFQKERQWTRLVGKASFEAWALCHVQDALLTRANEMRDLRQKEGTVSIAITLCSNAAAAAYEKVAAARSRLKTCCAAEILAACGSVEAAGVELF
eukprot:GEMP01043375.1.p1 GENE.GEMP01043375.1~~GEMP01043375.1.p1  ORF type:complete len:376 (-),score=73.91 GEMP01043375.1:692-1786(-)